MSGGWHHLKGSTTQQTNKLKKGDFLGWIGDSHENGNWVPHLHFQILLSLLDIGENFPGVGYQKHIESWKSICPDPDLIFIEDISTTFSYHSSKKIITDRKNTLGKGLSLQYKNPLHIVRGEGIFLIDKNATAPLWSRSKGSPVAPWQRIVKFSMI